MTDHRQIGGWDGTQTKNVHRGRSLLLLTLLLAALLFSADRPEAAHKQTKVRWVKQDGIYYAYDAVSGNLIRRRQVGRYYTKKDGSRVTNAFRRGVYYNEKGRRTSFKGGFVRASGKKYYFFRQRKLKGLQKIKGSYYLFDKDGAMLTGIQKVRNKWRYFTSKGKLYRKSRWKKIGGRRYYLGKRGIIREGFFKQKKKTYFQTAGTGLLTGLQVIGDVKYVFDQDGCLNDEATVRARAKAFPDSPGSMSDLVFFTVYESGSASYGQAGGDHGRAYGKYQFDFRYSLKPFLAYCLTQNSALYPEFVPFTLLQAGDRRLIAGNKKAIEEAGFSTEEEERMDWDLAHAWTAVYARDPAAFSALQDAFALNNYYLPAERTLNRKGVHLATRTYVERGAVYSYAIQEGASAAATAVLAAGITDATSSRDFLNLLYDYRWKDPHGWNQNLLYQPRYLSEKARALGILTGLGG